MASKFNPKEMVNACPFNVHELLEGNHYVIPDYQRDFVWKESQVVQLWRDLRDHYKRNTKDEALITSPDAYFLGAIVVLTSNGAKTLEVIDGQQRLTTLTCMATVLFEKLKAVTKRSPDINGLQAQVDRM